MDKELKNCPFCGDNDISIRYFYRNNEEKVWYINHFCPEEKGTLTVVISVYGKSKEEVIKRWNKRKRCNKRIGDK